MRTAATFGRRNRPTLQPKKLPEPVQDEPPDYDVEPMRSLIPTFAYSATLVLLLVVGFVTVSDALSRSTLGKGEQAEPAERKVDRDLRDIQMARLFCDQLNAQGAGTAPCEVGVLSITVHSNSTVAEARELCRVAVQVLKQQKYSFNAPWTFHVKSPYSGGQSIAYCRLP